MAEKKQQLAQFTRDAEVKAESFNADANTVEIVWTTGASVRRYSWLDGEEYDEVLSLEPGAVRLDRLNLGAPFLDTHCSYALENVIGSVVPGSAKVDDGRGTATVKLSQSARAADTVKDIRDGVIRNISVGYWIHKVVKTEGDDKTVSRWDVVDWEPLEVSAVPIPADPGSQIRSESAPADGTGPAMRSCTFVTKTPAKAPTKESRMAATRKPAAKRGKKTVAELEAENARLAALLAAKRDEDKKKDEESDDERDGDDDEDKKKGEESDDERDGDDDEDKKKGEESDDERDGDDDEERDCDEDDDKRAAPSAKDVRAAAQAAVKAERVRSAEITAIAERAGLPKLGRRHIDKGTSVRGFRNILLERLLDKQDKEAPIRGLQADEDVVRERNGKTPASEQRQMELGAAHWRKVAGKPEAKA